MAVGIELFYFHLNGTNPTINTYVKILDISNVSDGSFSYTDRNIDVSGSRISLNKNGTKLAVVDNYDISSNSTMYGSVSIYDIENSNLYFSNKFWGSENIEYPMYRNCSINDTGNTIAIGEFKLSYKPVYSFDGQILVHELSGGSWGLKGFPIRQTVDVEPTIDTDTLLTGESLGYKLILDSSGSNVMTSTRPKLNMKLSIEQGKGYIYKWMNNDKIYKFNIITWPVIVRNLTPSINYNFRIYAMYEIDLDYSYFVDISASTLSGEKPDVYYSIYNDQIQLSWDSVKWNDIYDSLKYTVLVTQGSAKIVDFSINQIHNSNETISFDISNLTHNTPYYIIVASEFTRGINAASFKFVYKTERLVSTLNERSSKIIPIALNSSNLVVFDIENAGMVTDISQNKVTLTVLDLSYSFVIIPPSMLDISHLQINDIVTYSIETTYKQQPVSGRLTYNNTIYDSSSGSFVVSNAFLPDTLISNGRFNPVNSNSYSSLLEYRNIRRYPVDISKGIYRTIPPVWSDESNYIVTVENQHTTEQNSNISVQNFLNVADISYHAVLYRSEDLSPGEKINPANLTQFLQGSVFARPYTISFYIRNQDMSTAIYDISSKIYFSDDIKYQIEFADTLNDDYVFYKSSPIRNTNKDWAIFRCHVNFPISRKNVKYTIRRLDKETNNLLISDISMIFTNKTGDPPWHKFHDGSWNCLSNVSTPWKDIWTYDGSFQVIPLSCNMSISCWVYLHYTDVSQCIFLLGTDVSNGTPGIYIDNSNVVVKNVYDDSSYNNIISTPSVLGVPIHFVVTYFNSTISIFLNGIPYPIVEVSGNTIREAYTNYNIYLGNPNDEETLGVVLKSVKLYDYPLDLSFISNTLYKLDKAIYQIGNPYDISNNKISTATYSSTNTHTEVTLRVLDKPDLSKYVYLNSDLLTQNFSDVSSVSMWIDASSTLTIDNSDCVCTEDIFTFRDYQIKLNNDVNHFVITSDPTSMKLYMNGYLYLTDSSPITTISGSNLGEVITWNKILSESNVLTSYYNYYSMYSTYDISGHYMIYVKYPKGISQRDVSYNISANDKICAHGNINLPNDRDEISFNFKPTGLSLNAFNGSTPKTQISVSLVEYEVLHDISLGNLPYIDYSWNNNLQYLTEETTIDFRLKNISQGSSFPYTISEDITESDLSNSNNISGDISLSVVSITLKEDYHVEDWESFYFSVPSLNLSISLKVYDRFYLTSTEKYANDVFVISLRNKTAIDNLSYTIMGVSGEDISGVGLTGTFIFNQNNESLSIADISFTVTAMNSRINLPFKLMLTDFSYVSISVWLNEGFALTPTNETIKEGDEFEITLTIPDSVATTAKFAYTITGISNEDLDTTVLSGYNDLSGEFTKENATSRFKYKHNALLDQNKTLKITVTDVLNSEIAYLNLNIINVEPVFTLERESNTDVNEGESFTVTLKDLSGNLPDDTRVNYKLVYTSSNMDVLNTDVSANSNVFTIQDNSANVSFTAIADNLWEGNKDIKIMLTDFSNVYYTVYIKDTSLPPSYTLTSDKIYVNEGENFTITLRYSNIPSYLSSIPFNITGTGISIQDFSDLSSLSGEFNVVDSTEQDGFHIISKSFSVRSDTMTELERESVEFRLTSATNSNVNVVVGINDSSKRPNYSIDVTHVDVDDNTVGNINNITLNEVFSIELTTTSVPTGTMVNFTLSDLSDNDLSFNGNSLSHANNNYSGTFTVGTNYRFELTSMVVNEKNSYFSLSTLPFTFNRSVSQTTSQIITFNKVH